MKDELKRLLDPADDGRAFTDAVLFKASGALHRRRTAAEASEPAWEWLARWARPWVVAALVAVAVIALYPFQPSGRTRAAAQAVPAASEVMSAALLPPEMAVAATTDAIQER